MLTLYQIASMQVKPACHPKGWRVYRRADCCYKKAPFKACQMNHVDCLRIVDSKVPRMVKTAARFNSYEVLERLPIDVLDDDTLVECINRCSNLQCVDLLHSRIKERDHRLVLKCGRKFLRNAIYMAVRYGWSLEFGEYLALHKRFDHLLYIIEYCQYDLLSDKITQLILCQCTNYSICFFLVKWLFNHENVVLTSILDVSDTALHAIRTVTWTFHSLQ